VVGHSVHPGCGFRTGEASVSGRTPLHWSSRVIPRLLLVFAHGFGENLFGRVVGIEDTGFCYICNPPVKGMETRGVILSKRVITHVQ
jgi:hypothetical protein